MALRSDSGGFLVGDSIDLSEATKYLKVIRSDVTDIKRALGALSRHSVRQARVSVARPVNAPTVVATLRARSVQPRDASGRFVSANSSNITRQTAARRTATPSIGAPVPPATEVAAVATRHVVSASRNNNPAVTATIATGGIPARDAMGRFIRRDADGNIIPATPRGSRGASGESASGSLQGLISGTGSDIAGVAGRGVGAIGAGLAGLHEADPSVMAFKEIAEPIKKVFGVFFGGRDSKEVSWLKRLYDKSVGFFKSQSLFDRTESDLLNNIAQGGGGSGDSGGMGIMPIILGALGLAGGGGGMIAAVVAAITSVATLAWGIFSDKGQQIFGDVGAEIITAWNKVTTSFAPITESISSGWDSVKGSFDSLVGGMVASWDTFTHFLKDKFGIDIPAIFKPVADVGKKAVEKVQSVASTVKEDFKSGANAANEAIKNKTGFDIKGTVSSLFGKAKEGVSNIGNRSENKAAMMAEMDSSGITDPKERAMIMAQTDHESGGFKYKKEVGNDAYFNKYDGRKDLGNTEAGDGARYKGRGFVQMTGRSNYAQASKDLGIDFINHPELAETKENSAKTAMWYWKKHKDLGIKARAGDISGVTKIINGGYNGLDDRTKKYGQYLDDGSAPSVTASQPSPQYEPQFKSQAIADSPGVPTQLNTPQSLQAPTQIAQNNDVGQDLCDRSMAHICTGGYARQ